MYKILNLTPHILNVRTHRGDVLAISPSGEIARVEIKEEWTRNVHIDNGGGEDHLSVLTRKAGEVVGLPNDLPGTVYIVSGMVQSHPEVRERADVFSPGPLIRNDQGQPTGCDGLYGAKVLV